jgi:uncharacterized membrane protein
MNNDDNKFSYTYSAPTEEERREIDSIRQRYVKQERNEESKLERLRKLDGKVRNPATIIALVFGIVGLLTFGLGLASVLEWNLWTEGIVLMIVGFIPVALAYPIHGLILARNRKKYGDEIIKLTEELLMDETNRKISD